MLRNGNGDTDFPILEVDIFETAKSYKAVGESGSAEEVEVEVRDFAAGIGVRAGIGDKAETALEYRVFAREFRHQQQQFRKHLRIFRGNKCK